MCVPVGKPAPRRVLKKRAAGAGYERVHTRVHVYVDPLGWRDDQSVQGCA